MSSGFSLNSLGLLELRANLTGNGLGALIGGLRNLFRRRHLRLFSLLNDLTDGLLFAWLSATNGEFRSVGARDLTLA
jgi:hypothetical protein